MNKESLVILIEAFADAKASRNQHLVRSMAAQLEQALDAVFDGDKSERGETSAEF